MPGSTSSAASLNIALLNRLRAAAGEFVPIDELARGRSAPDGAATSPDSDRGRVHAELDALAAFGFAIERHLYRGAAYHGPADRLCPDQIEHELSTIRIGRRIAVWNRVASTNDLAASACGSLSNDGLVVLADEQTAGRGRLGRSWTAPPRSSILMSVLLIPPPALDPSGPDAGPAGAWLTAMGAVATAEVVSAWTGRAAAIKWPNDVRIDGRKIAGILVERPARPPAAPGRAAVIGIGLNVNLDGDVLPADLQGRATSIRIERGGRSVDRSEVARDLIRRLDRWYEAVHTQDSAALNAAWRDRNELLGRLVRTTTAAGPRTGRLVDLDLRLGITLDRGPGDPEGPDRSADDRDAPARGLIQIPLAEVLAIEPGVDPAAAVDRPRVVPPGSRG